jgi:hypothetical protein
MNATKQKKLVCSCGRTFATEQTLKYHQQVHKHGATEEGKIVPALSAPPATSASAPFSSTGAIPSDRSEGPSVVTCSEVAPVRAEAPLTSEPTIALLVTVGSSAETPVQAEPSRVVSSARAFEREAVMMKETEVFKPASLPSAIATTIEEAVIAQAAKYSVVPVEPVTQSACLESRAEIAERVYLAALGTMRCRRAEQGVQDSNEREGSSDGFVHFATTLASGATEVSHRAVTNGISLAYQVVLKMLALFLLFVLSAGVFTAGFEMATLLVSPAPTPGSWTTVARA